MSVLALKKILTSMVIPEYPEIEDILVLEDNWEVKRFAEYKIFVGITPENMDKVSREDIKEKIKNYSLYILNPKKEKISQILFFNPNDWK